jgi:hypothetical protein
MITPVGDADEHLDAHPVGQLQVARVAGHGQPLLGVIGRGGAAEPAAHPRKPGHERAQGALGERLLELEFLEVLGLDRAELGQPGLDRDRPANRRHRPTKKQEDPPPTSRQ